MSARLQLRDIFNEDMDKLFSYRTPKLVIIKDRYLGLLKILINVCILIYFVVYVIIMQKAYLQEEFSSGPSIVYATGTAVSLDGKYVRVWDSTDVAYPQYDPSSIVISTNVHEQIRQKQNICIDSEKLCTDDAECFEGGSCKDGLCEEISWCSEDSYKLYSLDGVENFLIWVQGSVNFITMGDPLLMTTLDENKAKVYPNSGANSFLLYDILKIGNIDFDEVKKTGAVVRIGLYWECDTTWHDSCDPEIIAKRIDNIDEELGFNYDRYFYYKENGIQYRDHMNITGIKLQVESSGRIYALTLQSIILNASSAANLTMITPRIVDLIMLYVMKNRTEYRKLKFELTKDLNAETVEEVEENNDKDEEGRFEDDKNLP
ncbi:hypothetical protein SteCoe_15543 [Stentor coeruleus]|uniref:Uncharacterized protein n=1 Tax=Stentor coeruleus TaxID=5963 RepID=A0A1R2C3E7_9CILI|nr:hypothetical protein SteCoe_15543 [Stentor coeruleus]